MHTPSWAYTRYVKMSSWNCWALNASSWAHACSLLSIYTLADENACTTSWAYIYAHLTPIKQHLHTAVVHVQAFSWACTHKNWACAHFQLDIRTFPVEHTSHPHISMRTLQEAFSWACTTIPKCHFLFFFFCSRTLVRNIRIANWKFAINHFQINLTGAAKH